MVCKAYNSINRNLLFKNLRKLSVSGKILLVIKSMDSFTITLIAFGGKYPEAIETTIDLVTH